MTRLKPVFTSPDAFYFKGDCGVLKADKKTRLLETIPLNNPEFLSCSSKEGSFCGEIVTVLGRLHVEDVSYLFVVTSVTEVAKFHANELVYPIYRIDRLKAIPIINDGKAYKPDFSSNSSSNGSSGAAAQAANKFRIGQRALLKFVTDKIPGNTPVLVDEILRLFNDFPDFYFCFERDITHRTQKHFDGQKEPDERFFWNRHLLGDLFRSECDKNLTQEWIVPIVQGHVQSRDLSLLEDFDNPAVLRITLISRRSIHRAGVRYLRRGINNEGHVANFVETELLLNIYDHQLSFVQVRGSVPVFWSQRGVKYRPPLTIEKDVEESLPYFAQHCEDVLSQYGAPLVMVNLVDQTGRELKLAQSYLEHAIKINSPDTSFYSFDFHHHCRGLNFEKVNELVSNLEGSLAELGFCWVDRSGEVVRRQKGVVRTNCVDCLDRTNVVQGAISQFVCMQQAQRLGIFGPLSEPPDLLVQTLQLLWADNGDSISTQYAGTAALKGDMTRYGERKITGIMKDGYNSASRYYLARVRDASRQLAINALLDLPSEEEPIAVSDSDSDQDEDENVGRLVTETTHFLLPANEVLVGGWALVDSDNSQGQVDTVVLLSRVNLYIAVYDDDSEKLMEVRIVPFDEIKTLELGRIQRSGRVHLHLVTQQGDWAWRSASTRLFNNVAIRIKSVEEGDEYVESIAEQIRVTVEMATGRSIAVDWVNRLQASNQRSGKKIANMMSSMFGGLNRSARRQQNYDAPVAGGASASVAGSSAPTATSNPVAFTLDAPNQQSSSILDEANALEAALSTPALVPERPSSTIPPSEHRPIDIGDLEITVTDQLEPPSGGAVMRSSVSDGRLMDRATSGFVSKLKGLGGKAAPLFSKGSSGGLSGAPGPDPFARLLPLVEKSKTRVYLL